MFKFLREFGRQKTARKEEDVTEKSFGNVLKFRIGSKVSIGPAFTVMLPESGLFAEAAGDSTFDNMIVNAILSFDLDDTKVWRLHCRNPDALVQIQELATGEVEIGLYLLTQDLPITERPVLDEWVEYLKSDVIADGDHEYNRIVDFDFTEVLEANGDSDDPPKVLKRRMFLFDREVEDTVELMVFDLETRDRWHLEASVGVLVPAQEINIT